MAKIGSELKKLRNACNLSLKKVQKITGITDSRLSRIENDVTSPSIEDLNQLSQCYKQPLVILLQQLGYVENTPLLTDKYIFQNSNLLDDDEHEHIQKEINLFTRGRKIT